MLCNSFCTRHNNFHPTSSTHMVWSYLTFKALDWSSSLAMASSRLDTGGYAAAQPCMRLWQNQRLMIHRDQRLVLSLERCTEDSSYPVRRVYSCKEEEFNQSAQ